MELYSTKRQVPNVNFEEAIFKGLPDDNGLYMPTEIPVLPASFFDKIEDLSFQEIAFEVAKAFLKDEIPENDLKEIVFDAVSFEAPVKHIVGDAHVLELFHGPSLAFKDFGARFMARVMSYFLKKEKRDINILVATSGDTGSAVAQGFLGVPGIHVTILYPSGKVSPAQEKQLTTFGQNITALEIDGVFDDCQALVKAAFLDKELTDKMNLSSANSINIARLIPQSFYYFNAYKQVKAKGKKVVFSVPSGNFGNLCGGLIAQRMGLPVEMFIASTNSNSVVPEYLESGEFNPGPSIATISNAMDVGNPSNFPRMTGLFNNDLDTVTEHIEGRWYNDEVTGYAMTKIFEETGYIMCPHTAVAFLGLMDTFKDNNIDATGIFLSTAHPSKFKEVVDEILSVELELPERLEEIVKKEKVSIPMTGDYKEFKEFLLK